MFDFLNQFLKFRITLKGSVANPFPELLECVHDSQRVEEFLCQIQKCGKTSHFKSVPSEGWIIACSGQIKNCRKKESVFCQVTPHL